MLASHVPNTRAASNFQTSRKTRGRKKKNILRIDTGIKLISNNTHWQKPDFFFFWGTLFFKSNLNYGQKKNTFKASHTRSVITVKYNWNSKLSVITEHSKLSVITEHSKLSVITEHSKLSVTTEHSKLSVITEHSKLSVTTEHSECQLV